MSFLVIGVLELSTMIVSIDSDFGIEFKSLGNVSKEFLCGMIIEKSTLFMPFD